ARPVAEIRGYGLGFDPGRGRCGSSAVATITRVMESALRDAGLTPEEIDCVSTSANGSIPGDRHEALALEAVFRRGGPHPAVTAIKSMLGEGLGAAGAMQILALAESLRTGMVPGTLGLEEAETDFLRERTSPHTLDLPLRIGLVSSIGLDGNCC